MNGSDRYPSLSLIFEELKALLDRQRAHVDSLDSKASIVIGFTALVLGVAVGQGPTPAALGGTGVAFGAVSFLLALGAFWTRPFAALPRPREFFVDFANVEPEQTRLVLCNLAIAAFEANAPSVDLKSRALKLALISLVGSVGSFVLAFFLRGVL